MSPLQQKHACQTVIMTKWTLSSLTSNPFLALSCHTFADKLLALMCAPFAAADESHIECSLLTDCQVLHHHMHEIASSSDLTPALLLLTNCRRIMFCSLQSMLMNTVINMCLLQSE
jgi:hypothetical protein